jgi:hypothetical protein
MPTEIDRYTAESYRLMGQVLSEIGPRESCSQSERLLGRLLAERWRGLGHRVCSQHFCCRPKAFLGVIPIAALLYLVAIASFWRWPLLCALLSAAAVVAIVLELVRYREFLDPLFREEEGENVAAVISPQGPAKRRVVVSAHQDSSYEFNLWLIFRDAGVVMMVLALAAPFAPLVGGLGRAIGGGGFETLGWIGLALSPVVILHLFFHTFSVVPGAMDDLAGIAVLDGVARALAESRDRAGPRLEHTEVVLLATSAEEAGLRGAKRFVSAQLAELTAVPSYGLFVDGVYDERYLAVIDREWATGARHDPRLVKLAMAVAAGRGWPMQRRAIPFGASDASAFSTAGIPSVALLCQDMSRLAPNYHTRRDTLDRVRPESIGVVLELVLEMLERIDRGELPGEDLT